MKEHNCQPQGRGQGTAKTTDQIVTVQARDPLILPGRRIDLWILSRSAPWLSCSKILGVKPIHGYVTVALSVRVMPHTACISEGPEYMLEHMCRIHGIHHEYQKSRGKRRKFLRKLLVEGNAAAATALLNRMLPFGTDGKILRRDFWGEVRRMLSVTGWDDLTMSAHEGTINQLQEKITELEAKAEKLVADNKAANVQRNNFFKEMTAAKEQLKAQKELETALEEVKEKLKKEANKVARLYDGSELQARTEERDELEAENSDLRTELAEYKDEYGELE